MDSYNENYLMEIGVCCFCGLDCNFLSQSCGSCSRSLSVCSIGLNDVPNHLEEYKIKKQLSFEVDTELSKLEEKVWIGDIKCAFPKKLWKLFINSNFEEGTVTVTDKNKKYIFIYWSTFEKNIYIKNNDLIIGNFPLISGMVGVIPKSSLKIMDSDPLELEMGMFVDINDSIYPIIDNGIFNCGTIKIDYRK